MARGGRNNWKLFGF